MSRDIRTCIAILCCVLSVVNVSGLISDPQAIQDFLSEYNRQVEILKYNFREAEWILFTNKSNYSQQHMLDEKINKMNYQEAMFRNASQYDLSSMSPSDRRQFIKIMDIGTAAQANKTKIEKMDKLINDMKTIYSQPPDNSELLERLSESRDHDIMEASWITNKEVYKNNLTDLYAEYVNLSNEAVGKLGYADTGAYRRSWYDSPTFEDDVRRLFDQLSPFYEQLHEYIRRKLIAVYGRDKFPSSGHIPAHLFDNVYFWKFRQDLTPFPDKATVDITDEMIRQNYTARRIFETADDFFKTLGMKAVPPEFWNESLFHRIPDGLLTDCIPSAWDFFNGRDYRIKMCTGIHDASLYMAHHELGLIQYFMQYANQPQVFRDGANPAFQAAVGDAIILSVQTEEYLYKIGLLDTVHNDNESDINLLMNMALDKVPNLPFYYIVDQWRWKVFRGDITPDKYNEEWWNLTCRYQGVSQPVKLSSDVFYPGGVFQTADIRDLVGEFIKYQIHKALCNVSGYHGPLHRCDIYNNTEAGKKLSDVLKLGASKPWPEVLQLLTGQSEMDAGPYLEYFQPLMDYLKKENQNDYGWDPVCPTPKPKLCKVAVPGNCTCRKNSECDGRGCCNRGVCKWD